MKASAVAEEWCNNKLVLSWRAGDSIENTAPVARLGFPARVSNVFQTAFLPEGYPASVTADYLGFQFWDTVQGLCSYVRGILSGQAILKGVGVGQKAATPLGAVFQFFLRDMSGMLGGIVFAYFQGSEFDTCAKQWRIFADVINDIGMAVELASPMFPKLFLAMACFGSIARSMTGMAGGATRAALTQHFAVARNAADISAKENSQETAVTIVGMLLGLLCTRLSADSQVVAWLVFLLLTWLHVLANIRALRCLVLTSLNQPRLDYLVAQHVAEGKVSTPAQMAARESLLAPPLKALLARLGLCTRPLQRQFGAPLSALVEPGNVAAVRQLLQQAGQQRYLVAAKGSTALAVLHRQAAAEDHLRAHVHATRLAILLQQGQHMRPDKGSKAEQDAPAAAAAWTEAHYVGFVEQLKAAGWNLDRVTLARPQYTVVWALGAGTKEE